MPLSPTEHDGHAIRVLLQGRSARSLATAHGGDQVQIEKTTEALVNAYGLEARTSAELEPDLRQYDLVHLFGLVRPQEVWVHARNALRQATPIVLSTVYCDVWDFDRNGRTGSLGWVARHTTRDGVEAAKAVGRGVVSREWSKGSARLVTHGFRRMQRDVLAATSVFLPNSHSEWQRICTDFGGPLDPERVVIVPNGVDIDELAAAEGLTHVPPHLAQYKDCVLCVARIEGRKNQLSLIRALRDTPYTLVLAGRRTANQRSYVRAVEAAARSAPAGRVHLLGEVSAKDKLWLLRLARVHALPSWMETTGLASLEAGFLNCSLVVSPNGDTTEYFGGFAEFCNPADAESIRDATVRAWERPPSRELKRRIGERFTWTEAAQATLVGYRRALEMAR